MILTTGSRATTTDCDHVAKALVRKYPFLKEYVSLRCLLYIFINCFYNSMVSLHLCTVPKRQSKTNRGETKPKKPKVEGNSKQHSYPPLWGEPEDEHTHKRSVELLRQELTSGKPAGYATVKQLMSRKRLDNKLWVAFLEEYKVLKKIPHVR